MRNLAASLFGLEQLSGSDDLFLLGEQLNKWMSKNPDLDSLRRYFLIFFENSLKIDEDKPLPNPFTGDPMIKEKFKRWKADLKAEGRAEGKVEGQRTLLRRMKAYGMSIREIAEVTVASRIGRRSGSLFFITGVGTQMITISASLIRAGAVVAIKFSLPRPFIVLFSSSTAA